MSMNTDQLIAILERAHSYVPSGHDVEILIDGWNVEAAELYGASWNGEEFIVPFDEIDLVEDSFYEMTKIVVDAA